jgi:hypothetical protein
MHRSRPSESGEDATVFLCEAQAIAEPARMKSTILPKPERDQLSIVSHRRADIASQNIYAIVGCGPNLRG